MSERLTKAQIDILRRAARVRGASPYGVEHRVAERLVALGLIHRIYAGGWWPKTYTATDAGRERLIELDESQKPTEEAT